MLFDVLRLQLFRFPGPLDCTGYPGTQVFHVGMGSHLRCHIFHSTMLSRSHYVGSRTTVCCICFCESACIVACAGPHTMECAGVRSACSGKLNLRNSPGKPMGIAPSLSRACRSPMSAWVLWMSCFDFGGLIWLICVGTCCPFADPC